MLKIMNDAFGLINRMLITLLLALAVVCVAQPELLGHWQAQKDIAYDSIWAEWISDCDCTEPLE